MTRKFIDTGDASDLSAGQQERIKYCALLAERSGLPPKAFVAIDEPETALNPGERRGVIALLERSEMVSGATVVVNTHDVGLASNDYFDRLIILTADGRVAADGPPDTVLAATSAGRDAWASAFPDSWPTIGELPPTVLPPIER